MTPAARVQAAIELLDQMAEGTAAEKALTAWARRARYAGSKDRAAIRDHVYQALRCRDSYAARGGGLSGRQLMLGQIRAESGDPDTLFTGAPYAPHPLSAEERAAGQAGPDPSLPDLPDWLFEAFVNTLGQDRAAEAAERLRHRAPVTVRANLRQTTRDDLRAALAADGIGAQPVPGVDSALHLGEGARRLSQTPAYRAGDVELQDAHSQAAMAHLAAPDGARILDYCAGGGGKTLALAARLSARFFAHDADPRRLADLPKRAERAGIRVEILSTKAVARQAPFDLVLCDVPCSGSGTWRRTPEAKWRLTPDRLQALCRTQAGILATAARLTRPGGQMAYATCSVLREENEDQIRAFLAAHPDWMPGLQRSWPLNAVGDGFFLSVLAQGR